MLGQISASALFSQILDHLPVIGDWRAHEKKLRVLVLQTKDRRILIRYALDVACHEMPAITVEQKRILTQIDGYISGRVSRSVAEVAFQDAQLWYRLAVGSEYAEPDDAGARYAAYLASSLALYEWVDVVAAVLATAKGMYNSSKSRDQLKMWQLEHLRELQRSR